jgi:hypothetical protein
MKAAHRRRFFKRQDRQIRRTHGNAAGMLSRSCCVALLRNAATVPPGEEQAGWAVRQLLDLDNQTGLRLQQSRPDRTCTSLGQELDDVLQGLGLSAGRQEMRLHLAVLQPVLINTTSVRAVTHSVRLQAQSRCKR